MSKNTLSKTELEIMDYFWSINAEISASDLRNHFSSKNWSKQTISTFLKRLVNLGYLKIRKESIVKYYYSVLISKEEHELLPAKDVLENVYDGSYGDFFCALMPANTDKKEIDKLEF
mgnify:CR=1 FL=1